MVKQIREICGNVRYANLCNPCNLRQMTTLTFILSKFNNYLTFN